MRKNRVNMGAGGQPTASRDYEQGCESVTEWLMVRVHLREHLGVKRTRKLFHNEIVMKAVIGVSASAISDLSPHQVRPNRVPAHMEGL